MKQISNTSFYITWFVLVTLVHLAGMVLIDVMDVDASQYASISREMLGNGSYLQVMHRGADYLDKPPFLFWISALSFKLFGVSHFTYRLPSFLFILLGTWSVYALGRRLYAKETGIIAALIFYSSQAVFLMVHDVKTDTILVSAVIFSVWQLYLYTRELRWVNLLLGFTGIAIAMLEKGPIGLMVPVLALSTHFIYERSWKNFFRPAYLAGLIIVLILLLPMCWGLYQQFDSQPWKTINGVKGESGLRFYFWTQSFGRITGENVWKNNTGPMFFVHNYLWAFLPWTIGGLAALFSKVKSLWLSRFRQVGNEEMLTIGGFLLPFIFLSLSKYKLPHYIFITFPFISLMTAEWISRRTEAGNGAGWGRVQLVLSLLMFMLALVILLWVFPGSAWYTWVILILLLSVAWFYLRRGERWMVLGISLLTATAVNTVMNTHFYPRLLQYQGSSQAARYLNRMFPGETVYFHRMNSHAFDFYAGKITPVLPDTMTKALVYTNEEGVSDLVQRGFETDTVRVFPSFQVGLLTGKFLNPATRRDALFNQYLVLAEKK